MRQLEPALQEKLDRVNDFERAVRPTMEFFRDEFTKWYKMWRSYKGLRSQSMRASTPSDRRDVMGAARAGFGESLFIPMAFGIVETMIPRMLSTEPRPQVTPADPASEDNVEGIKLMVNRQQHDTMFVLSAQTVAKWGAVVGLGIGKTTWTQEMKTSPVLQQQLLPQIDPESGQPVTTLQPVIDPATQAPIPDPRDPTRPLMQPVPVMVPQWVPSAPQQQVKYAGPVFEAIDPFDFWWDPDAFSMRTMERCIHRTWRSDTYCRHMFATGAWVLPEGWTEEDALRSGGRSRRDEVWGERLAEQGTSDADTRVREIHEVWEFWSGNDVTVVLDRECVVAAGPNPYWHGEMPFQLFRPTEVMHEMVGIGEIEAIEDLQNELNTLRTQRRDNASLVLQRPFAYFDGFLDPKDIDFSAGSFWPMDGPPSEIIFPIPLQDIPFSSYREEDSLKSDADRTSGLSDSVMGGDDSGAPETATGVQMVHAAAGVRIQAKTRRFELETVTRSCEQWVSLNQQHVIEERVVAGPPKPGEGDREYSWYSLGPAELAGTFAVECEGGSMSPQNEVAAVQKAVQEYTLLRPDPLVEPRKLLVDVLRALGKRNPESWLAPEMPMIDPRALDLVRETLAHQYGLNPAEFDAMVAEAMDELEHGPAGPTFGSVGDQVPQSRESPQPAMAGAPQ